MTNRTIGLTLLVCSMLWVSSCSEVGITGRKQLNFVPDSYMHSMSFKEYDSFIGSHTLSTDVEKTTMVKRVGRRIADAVTAYCSQHGCTEDLEGYEWEFNLVDDPNVNAWCMPGGKVVVYTGLLPVAEDETGLAVVMGHEIAHAFAEHGAERMSQQLVVMGGSIALDQATKEQSETNRAIFLMSYGAGSQLGILAYSRTHESEADRLGLIFMSMAGYNPEAAIPFWQRMSAGKEGKAPPEFLSTHPSDQTRIDNIQRHLPEARSYYRSAAN
ncbi:M48 family metallopeptidase [Planctomycetota bacterium]